MAGVDLAMEGIPRYVKDLFFFFSLSFEVDAFEARHDVSNQQQHAFFDQIDPRFDDASMCGMSLLFACLRAKRAHASPLSSLFKNKFLKRAHENVTKTTEDLEYSKPPRSTFYGKRKGCSPPDRLPGNVIRSRSFVWFEPDLKGQNLGT